MSDVIPLNRRSSNPNRTTKEARAEVAGFLPGYLTHKDSGERVPHGGLSPRQVPKAWVQGLKDAGADTVKVAQAHLGGGKYKTLSLVVQFACPFDHLDETGEGWAKVKLKVNPYSGWVSIHEDSCRHCTQQQIEEWLITCPRCAAGEDLGEHPDHDYEGGFYLPDGDESPIAFVSEAMWQFERGQEFVAVAKASTWTDEKARDWLDSHVNPDGSFVISVEATYREAWALSKEIAGHPPKQFVEAGHRLRKTAGT